MHYDHSALDWIKLGDSGWRRASVTLDAGDTAWQPGSTSRVIYGPAVVTYDEAPDGGTDAKVGKVAA